MYLKKLEVQGFKSFADKIPLEFNSGITAVVGPNGSGKSNISDAVRWVLGEQSAKTLRGSKMEDVIFAGTEHRKPLGFAEVSLTIDNADHTLPVEFTEVTITRRVYRSGESEFFLNKTACRLKDIHQLFLDTGIGKDGYSIIGQGRIDEILSTKSEERRGIFEEASGIMKYKVRKNDAEKKLELTKQNLLRINDIIFELENQLEPLRQQSETAKRYLSLREELKELEVNVYLENISRYREKIKEFEEQYGIVKQNIQDENQRVENITKNNKEKTDLLKSLEEKVEISRQQFYHLESGLEKCTSEIKLNDEKVNNLRQNIQRLETEIGELKEKSDEIQEEEQRKNDKIAYLHQARDEYSSKLEEAERKIEKVLATLDESERYIEGLKTSVMDKLDILSDKKIQVNNVKSHIEGIKKREASIDSEIHQSMLEKDRELIKKEDLSENIYQVNEDIKKLRVWVEGLHSKKKDLEQGLNELRKNQNQVHSEFQFKSSRYKLLKDMENNLEGYHRSVREILQACQRSDNFGQGIHGALAQLITVEKKYETSIEMTLGSALQNIVTSSEEDAKRAIEFLKKNRIGRATFLPIRSVKGRSFDNETLRQIQAQEGFCGVASDLVQCDPMYREIILNLLGKVVVVENLDAGIRMARAFGYRFRIVTLEGDMLNAGGSMAGGSTDNKKSGILSRHREIDELGNEINQLRQQEESLAKEIQQMILQLEGMAKEISFKESEVKNNEMVKIRDESHLAQVEENIVKVQAKMEMLRQEKEQLQRQEKDTHLELQKYITELSEIEKDIEDTKQIISKHQEKHKEDQSIRDTLHRDITDYKISVNSILESIASVNEAVERMKNEKEALQKGIERKNVDQRKYNEEIKSLSDKNDGLRNLIKGYEEERTGKTLEIDRMVEEKKVMEEELTDTVDKLNQLNKNILLLQEEFNRIEVRKTKIESEMEAIQNRMWDEYELTYTNALEMKKEIGSVQQAQRKINEYKSQIRELGPVHVGAIEEYIKTKERYEFMTVQRNDMEQAKEKLHRVINEMISVMKRQFMEQFRLINQNFNAVFKELFDGGRAELILTDKENVLESGIEIEVQPPGKKLQNLMLLSGGERAFTAIALLFSILRLRPTPFCILDEIEAALDDANVFRFAQYLKKFIDQTQFIMVTHRKGTMEAADTLYGVTMQEHGVSKIVSIKMDGKAS